MKAPMIVLFLCTCLFGCASSHSKYSIEGGRFLSGVTIEFQDYEDLRSREANMALTQMRPASFGSIPAGGWVIAHITASTIGIANLDNWVFVVTNADGGEIQRNFGKFDIPHHSRTSIGKWWNTSITPIKEKWAGCIGFHAVNKALNQRTDFRICEKQPAGVPETQIMSTGAPAR